MTKQLTVTFDVDTQPNMPNLKGPMPVTMGGMEVGMVTSWVPCPTRKDCVQVSAILTDGTAIDLVTGPVRGSMSISSMSFDEDYALFKPLNDRNKLTAAISNAFDVLGLESPKPVYMVDGFRVSLVVRLRDSDNLGIAFESRDGSVYSQRVRQHADGEWHIMGEQVSKLEYSSDEGLVLAILTALHH